MQEIAYYNADNREGWGTGPWDAEKDKYQFADEASGLPCLLVRGPLGSWCGYVGVPAAHPLHGVHYDSVYELCKWDDVHGGLTFSGPCSQSKDVSTSICHVPDEGEPDDVWWFGFDTAHCGDYVPGMRVALRRHGEAPEPCAGVDNEPPWPAETYKTERYMRAEVAKLAAYLAQVSITPAYPELPAPQEA